LHPIRVGFLWGTGKGGQRAPNHIQNKRVDFLGPRFLRSQERPDGNYFRTYGRSLGVFFIEGEHNHTEKFKKKHAILGAASMLMSRAHAEGVVRQNSHDRKGPLQYQMSSKELRGTMKTSSARPWGSEDNSQELLKKHIKRESYKKRGMCWRNIF